MIIKCTCKHAGQDKLNGLNKRVANVTAKKTTVGNVIVRCTVCLNETSVKEIK